MLRCRRGKTGTERFAPIRRCRIGSLALPLDGARDDLLQHLLEGGVARFGLAAGIPASEKVPLIPVLTLERSRPSEFNRHRRDRHRFGSSILAIRAARGTIRAESVYYSIAVFNLVESMNHSQEKSTYTTDGSRHFLALVSLALITGVFAGLLGGLFRLLLVHADIWRSALIDRAHGLGTAGLPTVVIGAAILVAFAAWLVRRFAPSAAGSGIPNVEAALDQRLRPAAFMILIPIKFVGGVLAIGSGLALGREGPSVQMGASAGHFMSELSRRSWPDHRALIAAGAGAGLATAFNAPLAGAIFVLEELYKRFEIRIAVAALTASVTAIGVSRLLLGDAPDFNVSESSVATITQPLFFLLGVIAGLLAVLYNSMLLGALAIADRLSRVPVELRAGVIGAAVGALAWFAPAIVGGGDAITQGVLTGAGTLTMLPILYAIRLVLSTASYAAGTPGGLFAPMLVLGAQSGLFFGLVVEAIFPGSGIQPESFAIVGMAALFTGIVRAPLTGIILTAEMTGSVTLVLPMLAACAIAMVIPTLFGSAPIYDSLRERLLSAGGASVEPHEGNASRHD